MQKEGMFRGMGRARGKEECGTDKMRNVEALNCRLRTISLPMGGAWPTFWTASKACWPENHERIYLSRRRSNRGGLQRPRSRSVHFYGGGFAGGAARSSA